MRFWQLDSIALNIVIVSTAIVIIGGFVFKRFLIYPVLNTIHSLSFILVMFLLVYKITSSGIEISNDLCSDRHHILLRLESVRNGYRSVKIEGDVLRSNCNDGKLTIKKLLVFIPLDKYEQTLRTGDLVWINGEAKGINANYYPSSFDKRSYYAQKGIHKQLYLNSAEDYNVVFAESFSLYQIADDIRNKGKEILNRSVGDTISASVASALILGDKTDIRYDTKKLFATSGLSHVLAVSGLHVGIIYLLIRFVLLRLLKINNPAIKFIMVAILIWSYAILTGLSSSVMRAAFMITLIDFRSCLNRRVNIYNLLACSAFFLLCFNPKMLFDLGFQLSYSAVLGILLLHPVFLHIGPKRNVFLHYVWSLMAVSISAQIFTFPLTAYHFNQFPTYFLISNLIVLPFMGFLILLSSLTILLGYFTLLSNLIGTVLSFSLSLMMHFLEIIRQVPYSTLDIYLNNGDVWILYSCLILLIIWLYSGKKIYAYIVLGGSLCISVYGARDSFFGEKKFFVYAFKERKGEVLGLVNNNSHYVIPLKSLSVSERMIQKLQFYYGRNNYPDPVVQTFDSNAVLSEVTVGDNSILIVRDAFAEARTDSAYNLIVTIGDQAYGSVLNREITGNYHLLYEWTRSESTSTENNVSGDKSKLIHLPPYSFEEIEINSFEE